MIDFKKAKTDAEMWANTTDSHDHPLFGMYLKAVHNLAKAHIELGERYRTLGDTVAIQRIEIEQLENRLRKYEND